MNLLESNILKSMNHQTSSIGPSIINTAESVRIPIEIINSLADFKNVYPDPTKVAFVMMKFGNKYKKEPSIYDDIYSAIRDTLKSKNVLALRADGRQFHDDLLYDVLTYIYGCSFGIAVYEQIDSKEFNPNVAWEVGYLMALGKPVCLLKANDLRTLHTDLASKLYKEFDLSNLNQTIDEELSRWLFDKSLPGTHPMLDIPPIPQSTFDVADPSEVGNNYLYNLYYGLPENERTLFKQCCKVIDDTLRTMSRTAPSINVPFDHETSEVIITAIQNVYSHKGYEVYDRGRSRDGKDERLIEIVPPTRG